MSRNISPFGVRMPSELKAKIEESAKDNGRSINAEVVHRLEQSYTETELPLEPHESTKSKGLTIDEILKTVKDIRRIAGTEDYFNSDLYKDIRKIREEVKKITGK